MLKVGEEGTEQFHIWVEETNCQGTTTLTDRAIHDPFIRTRVCPTGWRNAWAVLCGQYSVFVLVDGTPSAHHVVFTTDYEETARKEGLASVATGGHGELRGGMVK